MSEDLPKMKRAGVGLFVKDGTLQGMVITGAEAFRPRWDTVFYPKAKECRIWERKEYSNRIERGEVVHRFRAKNAEDARIRGQKWLAAHWKKEEKRRKALIKTSKAPLAANRIQDMETAWLEANKTSWPNLHKAQVEGTDIETAIRIDLAAMGFKGDIPGTKEVAKALLSTTIGEPDNLDSWLVANWFHGEKLVSRAPKERLKIVKDQGHTATEKSLGMRLSRLGLTSRKLRE